MRILIAADMEGISGVIHWDQVSPGNSEYERFRRIMTADVNAAIRGALKAGAHDIQVSDGHAHAHNILIEELDARVQLNCGTPSPLSMVQGIDQQIDGVMFVGYHARVGTQNAILEHTWSSKTVSNVWINEQQFGEIGLNAALCGHFNVPVIMISGDQSACAEACQLLGPIEIAEVKQAHGRLAAKCLPPEGAQKEIEQAAFRAVKNLQKGHQPITLRPDTPITLKVELTTSEMADKASWVPDVQRHERVVSYTADNMLKIYNAFRSIVAIAG
jgi:D-amino peptidase